MGRQGSLVYERAFTEGYLSSMEAQFEMDTKVIESVMIAMGQEPLTKEQKRECWKRMEARREACIGCPVYSLAVWDHQEVG